MTTSRESVPESSGQDPTLVMERIHGNKIERDLIELASQGGTRIDGTDEQPERYAVNRLALSEADIFARENFIKPLMESAGMEVQDHPLGIIGTLKGANPDLAPLLIISHTDSVPRGDMYDGDLGVLGGINVIQAITDTETVTDRTIVLAALTGEEASAYDFALFGSRGMFHGLTEEELDAHITGGPTLRETLGDRVDIVKEPIIGEGRLVPAPYAVIELHVEQNDTLEKAGIDLGVVEAIASPVRFKVEFGDQGLEAESIEPANSKYIRVNVKGKSDHSGATPMGPENRADGLVELANLLFPVVDKKYSVGQIDIGDIFVDDQALNKVPGETSAVLRVSGESEQDALDALRFVQATVDGRNDSLSQPGLRFGDSPITFEQIEAEEAGAFFSPDEMSQRQKSAFELIASVNEIANSHAVENVVGTVGTINVSSVGKISLGLDVRGIDKATRDAAIDEMQASAANLVSADAAKFGEPLPGSGDPVVLDEQLVKLTKELIDHHRIGSSVVMFSAAGHDAQNAARAGIPTVMIFTQSNNGGIAHHPDAYTKPENLGQGVKALAALTLKLAS